MTKYQILKILKTEIDNKKVYQPYKATLCDYCGSDVEESDDYVFISDRKKLCRSCLAKVSSYLEGEINESKKSEGIKKA